MAPIPGIRIVTGPSWWKPSTKATQADFVSAELVQIKNGFWDRATQPEHLEYYCKYEALLRDGRRIVLPNRVSDIAGIKWDISALMDWQAQEVEHRLLGTPVLKCVINGEKQEIRGNWKRINAAMKKASDTQLDLDTTGALIEAWEEYAPLALLKKHHEAFTMRIDSRDKAAELGTRAHDLIDKWLKFNDIQPTEMIDGVEVVTFHDVHYRDRDGHEFYIDVSKEPAEVQKACAAFHTFWLEQSPQLIASEQFVADIANGVAGMIDNVSRAGDGAKIIIDYKTGNYIGESMLLQTSGYAFMFELCTGDPIERVYICQLDKATAEFKLIPVFENPAQRATQLEAWQHALKLYHWKKAEGKRLTDTRKGAA